MAKARDDQKITKPILNQKDGENITTVEQCEKKCQPHPACISFSFNEEEQLCLLHQNSVFDDSVQTKSAPGFLIYDRKGASV